MFISWYDVIEKLSAEWEKSNVLQKRKTKLLLARYVREMTTN